MVITIVFYDTDSRIENGRFIDSLNEWMVLVRETKW